MSVEAKFSIFHNEDKGFGYDFKDEKIICSEDDIPVTESELPMHLREGQYDVVLVNCDKDASQAALFKQILEKFVTLEDGSKVEISTLDENYACGFSSKWTRSKFQDVDEAMTRSTFMILFMSENFVKDKWTELMKDECIQLSIQDNAKKWCLLPLYTHAKSNLPFRIPWGLRSLKAIHINKMVRDKRLNDVEFEDLKKENLDPFFIANMAELLSKKLSLKLNRKASQANAIEKYKSAVMIERRNKLINHKSEQEIRRLREAKQLALHRERINRTLEDEMKKIEAMEAPELPPNFLNDNSCQSNPLDEDLLRLFHMLRKSGLSDSQAFACAKQVCAQENSQKMPLTHQTHSEVPSAIANQTIVNIHNASGIMFGDRNLQHSQIQPQSPENGVTQESQENQCESLEDVIIERTHNALEGRDDEPQQSETTSLKLKKPVENTDSQVHALRHDLTGTCLIEQSAKLIEEKVTKDSSLPKPVATVSPMQEDFKSGPRWPRRDPDQTRVKGRARASENSAACGGYTAVKTVMLNREYTTQNQDLSDETELKHVSNDDFYDDHTLVKGGVFGSSSLNAQELTLLDETEVKQISVESEETTLLKPLYSNGHYDEDDTLLKEEYREEDMTLSMHLKTANYQDETALKAVHNDSIPEHPYLYSVPVDEAALIRQSGSSVDPYPYWPQGDPVELQPSDSSTLVSSVTSSASDKTLVSHT